MTVANLIMIARSLIPYSKFILYGGVALASLFYFNHKVDEKADSIINDFRVEQQKVLDSIKLQNKELIKSFTSDVNKLEKKLEEDKEETKNVLREFYKEPDPHGTSGIDGKFLRD